MNEKFSFVQKTRVISAEVSKHLLLASTLITTLSEMYPDENFYPPLHGVNLAAEQFRKIMEEILNSN